MKKNEFELTILMPCLDEAETLATCIKKAQTYIDQNNVNAEILIADNGSTDGSQDIARKLDARVIDVPRKGYGSALIAGIEAAKGKYVIMGDADDSYDFLNLSPYMDKLRDGYDLVMGNRFRGGIKDNAMPPLHKYIGNPVLSFIGKLFFKIKVDDFHCGLRGFDRERISQLNLVCTGMEFASEMVVKSSLNEYTMAEVPTILSPDGRTRPPHLRSWRDGWRHLQFLLIFSPRWLFLYPGMALLIVGLIGSVMLARQPVPLGPITLDIHTLLFMAGSTITGLQLVSFSVLGHSLGVKLDLLPDDPLFDRLKK
ncbi:MAG: glycosyltransferase family 2 protein, partial [Desulfobacterales bacterium]|nr:glycosyltransferase family 2 protein [Desulfobacterales bacterium]